MLQRFQKLKMAAKGSPGYGFESRPLDWPSFFAETSFLATLGPGEAPNNSNIAREICSASLSFQISPPPSAPLEKSFLFSRRRARARRGRAAPRRAPRDGRRGARDAGRELAAELRRQLAAVAGVQVVQGRGRPDIDRRLEEGRRGRSRWGQRDLRSFGKCHRQIKN